MRRVGVIIQKAAIRANAALVHPGIFGNVSVSVGGMDQEERGGGGGLKKRYQ